MTRAYVYWSTNYPSVSGSPLVFTSNCPAASTISWSQLSNPYHGIAQAHLHLIQSPISSFDRCFSLNHIPCFYRILGIVLFFIIWWIIWLYHKSYYVLINTYFTWTYIEWKPMTSSWFQLSCFSFVSWSIITMVVPYFSSPFLVPSSATWFDNTSNEVSQENIFCAIIIDIRFLKRFSKPKVYL